MRVAPLLPLTRPGGCHEIIHMAAFGDFGVFLGYLLAFLAFLLCLVYGTRNWKKGLEEKDGDYREEIRWEKEEIELIERLP